MREAVRRVPSMLWMALIWGALALWAQDVRGMYLAVFCLALAPPQAVYAAAQRRSATVVETTPEDGG